jgi:hypothetical protein
MPCFNLKTEVARFSETMICYNITKHHNPEGHNYYIPLTSMKIKFSFINFWLNLKEAVCVEIKYYERLCCLLKNTWNECNRKPASLAQSVHWHTKQPICYSHSLCLLGRYTSDQDQSVEARTQLVQTAWPGSSTEMPDHNPPASSTTNTYNPEIYDFLL